MIKIGSLGPIHILEVLHGIEMQMKDGLLVAKADGQEIQLYFQWGLLKSIGHKEYMPLGGRLVQAGVIARNHLREALLIQPTTEDRSEFRIALTLIQLQRVSHKQLDVWLTQEAIQLLQDLLAGSEYEVYFNEGIQAPADRFPLNYRVTSLIASLRNNGPTSHHSITAFSSGIEELPRSSSVMRLPYIPVTRLCKKPLPVSIEMLDPKQAEKVKVMRPKKEQSYWVLVAIWIVVNLYFWIWWLQPEHLGNPILFVLMNLAFLYEGTVLPSFYTFYLGHMRRPKSMTVDLAGRMNVVEKVAVISLTVPGSESLEIVKQQMIAMTQISYPHDSWILVDKQHSPEIEGLARELGVFYFSRHDVANWGERQMKHWNQSTPPFKAKTKAGNVNSWIDAYGKQYSHFTQLDIDHKPIRLYLHKVLGFFLDKKVKWVQAPSVYGNVENWAARGSAEQEFVLQGPLQMGFYGFCSTPFIIGSHCTYSMEAIREIGGFQPTRAEDHLDTVFLAARGYEGVFLPEVIAVGDGPETFETYLAQQFAWAYSMIQVLFKFTPKCIKNYTWRQALQFIFVQTWYVLWSLSMFILFTLPVISLFLNTQIAHVSFGDFVLHSLPIAVVAFVIWAWSHPWHLPEGLGLSWRGIILHIARWPIVLSALFQVMLHVQKPYMITVKGLHHGKQRPFALHPYYPFFAFIALSLGACWFYLLTIGHSSVQGYLAFALQGAAFLLLIYITALVKDIKDMMQNNVSFMSILLVRIKPLILLVFIISIFIWTTYLSWGHMYSALVTNGASR
jgi:cellulose synthase (UDP-forming)